MEFIQVVAGIILSEDIFSDTSSTATVQATERIQNTQVLISKRHKNSHQGGRWEFPGGKVEKHELKEHALSRELKEELNISVVDSLFFKKIEFDYGDKQVELLFYFIRRYEGRERGLEGQQIRWVNLNELGEYLFPEANQPVVDALVTGLF